MDPDAPLRWLYQRPRTQRDEDLQPPAGAEMRGGCVYQR